MLKSLLGSFTLTKYVTVSLVTKLDHYFWVSIGAKTSF